MEYKSPTPLRLFLLFSSITAVTLGGGYVIVPVIGHAVEKRGWMTEKRYYDIFARAQAYPGPMALSTSMLVSLELCGFPGAVAAILGVLLPPFLVLIVVSRLLATFGSLSTVKNFLEGAGAVVPGIVAAMVWKNAKRFDWKAFRILELFTLTLLLVLFPGASLPILLAGIFLIYFIEGLWKH